MPLLDATPTAIMGTFQNAYLEQTGQRMAIGSEEYTLASIFSYVLSVYAGMVNASYDNRFIATAAGVFLDNIASQYGLHRGGEALTPAYFEGVFTLSDDQAAGAYPAGAYSVTFAGYTFTNSERFDNTGTAFAMRFVCAEPVSVAYSSSDLAEALVGDGKPFKSAKISSLYGASADASDDVFRDYIERNKRLFSPGAASAFEAAAILSQASVMDAHVLRQSESGFVAGKVKMYVKLLDGFSSLLDGFIIPSIHTVVSKAGIETIGQELEVYSATAQVARPHIGTVYVHEGYEPAVALDLVTLKLQAVCTYLNDHLRIGESLFTSRIIEMMLQPLPAITVSAMADFDLTDEEYERVKDFTIKGAGGSAATVMAPGPTAYIQIMRPTFRIA